MKREFSVLFVSIVLALGISAFAESPMSVEAVKLREAATIDEQMSLLYNLSIDYAAEFELGAWDTELDVEPAEDILDNLIPVIENAADADAVPDSFQDAKFLAVYDRYETDGTLIERCFPGWFYVRIPEANRAESLEDADAVFYLTETYEKRSDYVGEAYNCVYLLYAAWIDSANANAAGADDSTSSADTDDVYCIKRTVITPPQSGMGVLAGERLNAEQLWAEMASVFPTTELIADYSDGSITFRVTGSSCCVIGVDCASTHFEIPSEVDGMPVTGIESISDSSLEELILPEGIVYISGDYAIDCPSLTSISFPSTLRRITGEGVFDRTMLTALEFNDGLEEIGEDSVQGGGLLESVTLPDTIRSLGEDFLAKGLAGTWVSLPEGLKKVPSYFLTNTGKVECVFMPASIEEFGINILNSSNSTRTYAPEGSAAAAWAQEREEPYIPCSSAADMPKPELMNEGDFTYTVVEGEAVLIEYTGSEEEVSLPEELGGCPVAVIKMFAFYKNPAIKSLLLPESVRMLERWCIFGCEALEAVYVPGSQEEAYYFISDCENCIVYAPEDSLAKQEAEKQNFTCKVWQKE